MAINRLTVSAYHDLGWTPSSSTNELQREEIMSRATIATLCAAALLAALPLLSATAAPSTTQGAQPGITSDGPKLPPIYGGEVQEEAGPEAADGGVVTPLAVSRSGCINFPGQKRTYSLSARGRITYRVVPSRFFDVTIRVNYTTIAAAITLLTGSSRVEPRASSSPLSRPVASIRCGSPLEASGRRQVASSSRPIPDLASG